MMSPVLFLFIQIFKIIFKISLSGNFKIIISLGFVTEKVQYFFGGVMFS